MKVYLVCYDICDDGRLRKVYKLMRGYGDHLQYSVFRCVLSDIQMATLKSRLDPLLKHDEDQVLVVPLGSVEAPRTWKLWTMGVPLPRPERVVRVL
jgi:CRISPR-associated protein Cas2